MELFRFFYCFICFFTTHRYDTFQGFLSNLCLNNSVTLFAFDKNEEISTHTAGGDALVLCLEGTGKFTVDGVEHLLTAGEALVMPAGHPHAVFGQERFKMLLMVAK